MDQDVRFDVALSYSSEDAWAGKDLYNLITRYGFSVYCYDYLGDHAHGFLRTKLRDIYRDSRLNVILWSGYYDQKPQDSIVAMERRCITTRHVEKGDAESLFILSMDDTPLHRDLEDVLAHRLQHLGLLGVEKAIIARLKKLASENKTSGVIQHPFGTEADRGPLYPCSFFISPLYKTDPYGRWQRLADVLVEFPNPLQTRCVYLIPSGLATPILRHSMVLKSDPKLLARKREVTVRFINEWMGHALEGSWFAMRIGEEEFATVYSPVYDRFLNASLHD